MTASRRRFLRLVAAGSAAVVAGPVAAAVKKAPRAKRPVPAKPAAAAAAPPTLAEEIRKQKASLEQSLKALRDYPLPAGGGEPGFTFVPLKARRKERAS